MRLGKSGLKVSKIILGTMSYGSPEWQKWVLPEEQAIEHIKVAYVFVCRFYPSWRLNRIFRYEAGINTFDTADVSVMNLI